MPGGKTGIYRDTKRYNPKEGRCYLISFQCSQPCRCLICDEPSVLSCEGTLFSQKPYAWSRIAHIGLVNYFVKDLCFPSTPPYGD